MSKSHQLSAGGAATKGEQRQDHPAGGTLVRVIRMAPPGGPPRPCIPVAWLSRPRHGRRSWRKGERARQPPGLQFGLQFTTVRPSSAEYAPPGWAAARTPV